MHNTKTKFVNKFSDYLENKTRKERREELFGLQFEKATHPHQQQLTSKFPFSGLPNSNRQSVSRGFNQPSPSQNIPEEETPVKRRRLKKLRQLQENQCGICLQQIKRVCWLKCRHKFCIDCAKNWFDTSNNCPYCRAETRSYWYKGEEILVKPKAPAFEEEEDSFYQQDDEEMNYNCYNCDETKEGDVVLICDQCQVSACHVACDSTLHGIVPEGDWICHFCR